MADTYLVIGGNGLVGHWLIRNLKAQSANTIGTYCARKLPGLKKLNILNFNELKQCFDEIKPSHVFFCANLSGGVVRCEKDARLAQHFHETAVQHIGTLCRKFGSTFVFLSSDYVFDGKKHEYTETDAYSPLNVYGSSKMNAEKWLLDHLQNVLILRTTNIYGWDPHSVTPNYMMQFIRALQEHKTFVAVENLFGHPTYVDSLAKSILELTSERAHGIYHVVGDDYMSRYEWIETACKTFELDFHKVKRESVDFNHMKIKRPAGVRLSTHKFKRVFQTPLLGIKEGLRNMKNDMCAV